MSWGTELWDQYDNVADHTQKGIEFLEKYGHFVDQRSKIELDYAGKLRRLVKNHIPKRKLQDEQQFTYAKAFKVMLSELSDQAGQHELIAENLSVRIVQNLTAVVKQLKDERRKYLSEGSRIQQMLQTSLTQLNKTRDKYEKAFGISEKALENYKRADDDLNLSRAEVEKHRVNSTIKGQQCEVAKNEYANQLLRTNEFQGEFYSVHLPTVLHNVQELDSKRIKISQTQMKVFADTQLEVLSIVRQCLDGIVSGANAIDCSHDSNLVIDLYKSGFRHPTDIPFEDLSVSSQQQSSNKLVRRDSAPQIANSQNATAVGGGSDGGAVDTSKDCVDGKGVGGSSDLNGCSGLMSGSTMSVSSNTSNNSSNIGGGNNNNFMLLKDVNSKSATLSNHSSLNMLSASTRSTSSRQTGGRNKLMALFAIKNEVTCSEQDGYADLPPSQRRKRLLNKLDELNGKIGQERASREGLIKMKEVYEGNPALGDPKSIMGQLNDNQKTLDDMNDHVKRFQAYLDEVDHALDPQNTDNSSSSPASSSLQYHHVNGAGGSSNLNSSQSSGLNTSLGGITNSTRGLSNAGSSSRRKLIKEKLAFKLSKISSSSSSNSHSNTNINNSDKDSIDSSVDASKSNRNSNTSSNLSSSSFTTNSNNDVNIDENDSIKGMSSKKSMLLKSIIRNNESISKKNVVLDDHALPNHHSTVSSSSNVGNSRSRAGGGPDGSWNRRSTITGGISLTTSGVPESHIVKASNIVVNNTNNEVEGGERVIGTTNIAAEKAVTRAGETVEDDKSSRPQSAVGKCRAMYSFEVSTQGSIQMNENEKFWLLENDEGDGWCMVKRMELSNSKPNEGFVPSAYLEILESKSS